MSPSTEPVAVAGAIQTLLAALIALALQFDWVSWTDSQIATIMAVYAAVIIVLTSIARSRVSPTSTP